MTLPSKGYLARNGKVSCSASEQNEILFTTCAKACRTPFVVCDQYMLEGYQTRPADAPSQTSVSAFSPLKSLIPKNWNLIQSFVNTGCRCRRTLARAWEDSPVFDIQGSWYNRPLAPRAIAPVIVWALLLRVLIRPRRLRLHAMYLRQTMLAVHGL